MYECNRLKRKRKKIPILRTATCLHSGKMYTHLCTHTHVPIVLILAFSAKAKRTHASGEFEEILFGFVMPLSPKISSI